jgi:hypothetical protein
MSKDKIMTTSTPKALFDLQADLELEGVGLCTIS